MYRRLCLCVLGIVVMSMPLHATFARDWKPAPHAAAREYGILKHERSPTDYVVIFWVPAESIPGGPESDQARKMLRDNMLIGTVRIKTDAQGRMSTFDEQPPAVRTLEGSIIQRIEAHEISPAATGMVTMLGQTLSQAMGVIGQGIKWWVFDGELVNSCSPGGFIVTFAGQDYDYQSPIPGCGDQI